MLRTLLRRDVIKRHSHRVSLSNKADPDQKLRDNVRYHTTIAITTTTTITTITIITIPITTTITATIITAITTIKSIR